MQTSLRRQDIYLTDDLITFFKVSADTLILNIHRQLTEHQNNGSNGIKSPSQETVIGKNVRPC